ncbi:hypothetical protein C0J45_23871 [Silurus meridionalis]|nr:hypothetical protein C0J45_23871 [Silurus meridionalis]
MEKRYKEKREEESMQVCEDLQNLCYQFVSPDVKEQEVAIVKVKGHAAGDSEEIQGNILADKVAKEAAKQPVDLDTIPLDPEILMMSHIFNIPDIDLKILQSQPTEEDIKYWASKQCKSDYAAIINDVDEKIDLLKLALIVLVKHYVTH